MTPARISAHFIGLAANIQLIQIYLYWNTEITLVAVQLLLLCITDAGENDDDQWSTGRNIAEDLQAPAGWRRVDDRASCQPSMEGPVTNSFSVEPPYLYATNQHVRRTSDTCPPNNIPSEILPTSARRRLRSNCGRSVSVLPRHTGHRYGQETWAEHSTGSSDFWQNIRTLSVWTSLFLEDLSRWIMQNYIKNLIPVVQVSFSQTNQGGQTRFSGNCTAQVCSINLHTKTLYDYWVRKKTSCSI